uniref:DUF3310 domain-containing protein n=1 Tax=Brochothrix campestris TaxID=2757 RepID=UPI003D4A96EB
MEYKGKQYEEVTDCSAEIGDLLQPSVDMELPDGHSVADYEKDSFKRYREIKKTDNVNSPSHYTQTKYEAIDIIEDVTQKYQSNVQYHIGNAIKYLIRAPFKNNTVEDLKKAVWYINRAVKSLEGVE